ncbi:MAG: radical SAM protein [Nitrososphaerota archaeon]
MSLLLISPPTSSVVKEILGASGPPLGLAYLAAVAEEQGWKVRIIDGLTEGLSMQDIAGIIRSLQPEIAGITATTPAIYDAYEIARIVKEHSPNSLVLLGGPHATFMAHEVLEECPYIDVVVRGEAEETLKEILERIERGGDLSGVAGITYRAGDRIRENPLRGLIDDLDSLPIPAYNLLPMEKYVVDRVRYAAIVTSRGCPYGCIFCSSSLQFGKRWRAHSPERVLEELMILRYDYGAREIEFLDDTFTLKMSRAEEISRMIVSEGLDISWSASSRVNTFSRSLGEAMRRAGAHTIYFGIESGSDKTLRLIGKGITRRQAVDAVKAARNSGLNALGSFIIGFPHEGEEDIRATIKFADKVGVDLAQFTIATPYPGTRLWEIAVKENLLLTRNWRKFTTLDVVMRSLYLTPERIKKLLLWAYITFYLNPRRVLRDIIVNRCFILRRAIPGAIRYLRRALQKAWE